jgi:hypothetical protein
MLTFTPTVAGPASGTLTLVDDDPTSPQTIPVTADATALQVIGAGPNSDFLFWDQPLLTTSAAQQVTLTNVGTVPVSFQTALTATSGTGFAAFTDCKKSQVPPGASCRVSVTYRPNADGISRGTLTITPSDPIGPQTVELIGDGVGIGNLKIRLHYDYMVATDHTHDPEVVSPGAVQRVINTFAQHGVELIVDPNHTAIPEVQTVTFSDQGFVCPNSQANFFDLRNLYFAPKFPDQHYTIFAHSSMATDTFNNPCTAGPSGDAEFPGLNFVVSLARFQNLGFPSDVFSLQTSGTLMHELGHNLGLHHGGGLGFGASVLNYKPNYLSVMNYNHQFTGVIQSDAVGSRMFSQCSQDSDCGTGQSCISYALNGNYAQKSCRKVDYSTQLLPSGGNTPGSLDEHDLDETAGLGSWNLDLGLVSTCQTGVALFGVIASTGPVDWDGDGAATSQHLAQDIDFEWWASQGTGPGTQLDCNQPLLRLYGSDDWAYLLGTAAFPNESTPQSIASSGEPTAASGDPSGLDVFIHPSQHRPRELDLDEARQRHVLLAPRHATLAVSSGCRSNVNALVGTADGIIQIALLAAGDFDVTQVDLSSLRVHRAAPVSATWLDVDRDGVPDLVVSFRASDVKLSGPVPQVHLTGWLNNSQAFFGEENVPACH